MPIRSARASRSWATTRFARGLTGAVPGPSDDVLLPEAGWLAASCRRARPRGDGLARWAGPIRTRPGGEQRVKPTLQGGPVAKDRTRARRGRLHPGGDQSRVGSVAAASARARHRVHGPPDEPVPLRGGRLLRAHGLPVRRRGGLHAGHGAGSVGRDAQRGVQRRRGRDRSLGPATGCASPPSATGVPRSDAAIPAAAASSVSPSSPRTRSAAHTTGRSPSRQAVSSAGGCALPPSGASRSAPRT